MSGSSNPSGAENPLRSTEIDLTPHWHQVREFIQLDKWTNEVHGPDADSITTADADTYMINQFNFYEKDRLTPDALWDKFRENFQDWDEVMFDKVSSRVRERCRDWLKAGGIHIGSSARGNPTISQRLVAGINQ